LQHFFYQLLVLVSVKCEYISRSPYIAKEKNVKHSATKHKTEKK